MPIASPSRRRGKLSAMIEYAAGDSTASPTPTPMRAMNRPMKLDACPQATVARLQAVIPAATALVRCTRSISRPIGIEASVKKIAKLSP